MGDGGGEFEVDARFLFPGLRANAMFFFAVTAAFAAAANRGRNGVPTARKCGTSVRSNDFLPRSLIFVTARTGDILPVTSARKVFSLHEMTTACLGS